VLRRVRCDARYFADLDDFDFADLADFALADFFAGADAEAWDLGLGLCVVVVDGQASAANARDKQSVFSTKVYFTRRRCPRR